MDSLTGKVAVVTGGTKGLGRAIAESLAESGADVVAASRNADPSAERVAGVSWDRVDVTKPESLEELMQRTARTHGGPHIVIANAGENRAQLITRMALEDWRSVVDTNLTGTFNTIRAAVHAMEPLGGGRIVTVSSCMADSGPAGAAAYVASKAAIQALTMVAAQELARIGITVSCVAPGILDTGMGAAVAANPRLSEQYQRHLALGRPCTAEEIGHFVAFMAGPDGAVFNGATLPADGGLMPWT